MVQNFSYNLVHIAVYARIIKLRAHKKAFWFWRLLLVSAFCTGSTSVIASIAGLAKSAILLPQGAGIWRGGLAALIRLCLPRLSGGIFSDLLFRGFTFYNITASVHLHRSIILQVNKAIVRNGCGIGEKLIRVQNACRDRLFKHAVIGEPGQV